MTKFEQKTFTEVYGSKKYRDNWEETFGKKDGEEVVEEDTHYDNCNMCYGGVCNCGLIEQSDPDAKEKCSNCDFRAGESIFPDTITCSFNGSSYPNDYHCENYREKK